ncbi:MAG: glycoside hydrolase family 2 TIM barrel-domain containing protein [Jejuia sp.]
MRVFILSFLLVAFSPSIYGQKAKKNQDEREHIQLSNTAWYAQLDEDAQWQNDTLYLPSEVELSKIPVNPPTEGWQNLYKNKTVKTDIPVSIEELFSKGINSYAYHGVSWLWCDTFIPENWKGKYISFDVEKARLRIEIYINEQLAGYDLIAETPYSVNVSDKLQYGKTNRIAIRLTNPGGQRGWADYPSIGWGKYRFPASHDFSGVGHITITAKSSTYIDDIFVKTLPPISEKKVEISGVVINNSESIDNANINLSIASVSTGKTMYSSNWKQSLSKGNNAFKKHIVLKKALPWDIDNPNLYRCEITIKKGKPIDNFSTRFGLRTFEIKQRNGNPSFYVNGKRIRIRSAIDWGYYAHTGFYATPRQARKSVNKSKEIGHNMLSFHRRIGEPEVLNYADKAGLYLYEEPGGFRGKGQGDGIPENTFTAKVMLEKVRRMVLRDRNHPSLIWYTLANEDPSFTKTRKKALEMVNQLDNSRLICNSSGWGKIEHFKPYDSIISNMLVDDHSVMEFTAHSEGIPIIKKEKALYSQLLEDAEKRDRSTDSESRFRETDFFSHQKQNDSCITYWGEVRCFTGPPNWYKASEMQKEKGYQGYDMNIYKPMRDKLEKFFNSHDFPNTGSKNILSPADLSTQAGRGLMYIDGRLEQIIMSNDLNDGFAINGWTSGPQLPLEWESAILDEARNLKGPLKDFTFWNRTNQIAIFRQNGKYFKPNDTIVFKVGLINEAKLPKGKYQLNLHVTDGNGAEVLKLPTHNVTILGGETHAQNILEKLPIVAQDQWKAGYITLHASLLKNGKPLSNGSEQVLFQNRSSYKADFTNTKGLSIYWNIAKMVVLEAGGQIQDYTIEAPKVDYILAGTITQNTRGRSYYGEVEKAPKPSYLLSEAETKDVLRRVKNDGTTLIVNVNDKWFSWLFEQDIISKIPMASFTDNEMQTKFWNGNGWGYIDHFIGNQPIPSGSTIGTTSWEPPSGPAGFFPFESNHPTKVYGSYFENGGKIRVLIGEVAYGKGKVILSKTYPVNANHAFNDLLFYNMILKSLKQ